MKEFTLSELSKRLRKMPKLIRDAAERGIRRGAQLSLAAYQRSGDSAPPASVGGSPGAFNTGAYRRSWKVRNVPGGARIYNAQRYADVIDKGRRRGRAQPPTSAIERWAQLKLRLSREEAHAAAYPIARAIGRRGLKGRRVMSRANPKARAIVVREMRAEVARAMRSL